MSDVNETLAERGSKYGIFAQHARVTQDLKKIVWGGASYHLMASDQKESREMIVHKIGRILCGDPDYDDSWRDIAGYAMLVCNRLNNKGPQ